MILTLVVKKNENIEIANLGTGPFQDSNSTYHAAGQS